MGSDAITIIHNAGTSQHMFVEFVSSPAGPLLNTGFHFNVGNWPGHVDTAGTRTGACDWMLSSDALKESNASEGIFLSIAHWYPPNTTCSYHIQGNEGEVVRLYFPRFVQMFFISLLFISSFKVPNKKWCKICNERMKNSIRYYYRIRNGMNNKSKKIS